MQSHPKLAQGGKFSLTVYLITGNRMKQRLHNLHMSMNHFYIYSFYNWERNEMRLHNLIWHMSMHHFSCHTTICYILQREKSSTWRDTCCRAFHVPPELEFPLQCASVEENISHLSRHFWRWFSFSPGEICSFPGGYHMHNIHDAGSLIEMFFVDRMFLW